LITISLALLYTILLIRTAWICDDAYITFRTIANLAGHDGLVYNVGERVQAYTHPLWMLVHAIAFYFTHEFYFTSIALSILISLATLLVFSFLVAKSRNAMILGVVILMFSRAYIDYSTSGLENPLSHLLLLIFLTLFFREGLTPRKVFSLALIASLGFLNRADSFLLYLPVLIYAVVKLRNWRGVSALFLGLILIFLWELFSLIYYGFPFPNTAYAKLYNNISTGELIQQGFYYLLNAINSDPVTPFMISLGFFVGLFSGKWKERMLGLGILSSLIYIVFIGGDFMSGRFLTMPLLAAVAILAQHSFKEKPTFLVPLLLVLLLGFATPFPTLLSHSDYGSNRSEDLIDKTGISDERAYYYPTTGLLTARRYITMPNHPWVHEGLASRADTDIAVAPSGLGFFGYYIGRDVYVVDQDGLSDPLLAHLNPIPDINWRIGHFNRWLPEGYLETLETGENRIVNLDLAAYYDRLSLVLRGRLFDPQRLAEIWKLNTGKYDDLLERYENSLLVHASLEDIQYPDQSKLVINKSGHVLFDEGGIEIELGELVHHRSVEVQLDARSSYLIFFKNDSRIISKQVITSMSSHSGMETFIVGISAEAAKEGFSSIIILPSRGGGSYPIASFRFME